MTALLSGDTEKGDLLAIVVGASLPIVLRKAGDGFRTVRCCDIHHTMDGPALGSHLWRPNLEETTLYQALLLPQVFYDLFDNETLPN